MVFNYEGEVVDPCDPHTVEVETNSQLSSDLHTHTQTKITNSLIYTDINKIHGIGKIARLIKPNKGENQFPQAVL